jgi:DNA-binding IclR family transcriptional regulator
VVRLLGTLERADFIERVPGSPRQFRIGLAACEVGALYFQGNPLLRGAEDVLQDLATRTGVTAYLGALYGNEVVILAVREGRLPVRFTWQAGERLPVATTALGKAMLMHMDASAIDRILGSGPLAGLTEGSIRTRTALNAQLAKYAAGGWVPAFQESFPGVYAVGAAILDPKRVPVAGLSLSFLGNTVDAARIISRRLGPSEAYGQARLVPTRGNGVPSGAAPHSSRPHSQEHSR